MLPEPRRALSGALALLVLPLGAVLAVPATASADDPTGAVGNVVINEVSSNGFAGGDFIELHNRSSTTIDLTGYHLKDNKPLVEDDVPLDGKIPPQGYVVVYTDSPSAGPKSFGLGATDEAHLVSPDGLTTIDSHAWTTHRTPSWGRSPDATGDLAVTTAPTPGGPNVLASTAEAQVTLNEVFSDGASTSAPGLHDYVEIHNGGSAPVDLTGWYVTDGAAAPTPADRVTLGGATAILPAAGYLAVETELHDSEVPAGFTYLPASNGTKSGFGLSKTDWVFLFRPDGTLVATTFKGLLPDEHANTWSRVTSGTGLWRNGADQTPGAINTFPGGGGEAPPLDPRWDDIEINEIASLNDDDAGNPGFGDAVELVNTGVAAVSIEGWHQTDSGAASGAEPLLLADLRVWDGDSLEPATDFVIPAGGHVAFSSTKGLSGEGDSVKVYGPGAEPAVRQLVDEASYGDGDAGVSDSYESDSVAFAACPEGSDEFWRVTVNSFGRDNTASCATKSRRLDSPVVLNEVSNTAAKAELLNTGTEPVDISGWQLLDSTDTVVHTVPAATVLAAGGYHLAEGVVGLDSADSLTIRDTAGSTAVGHTWFEDGIASYSRCELFGDVTYVETPTATWGAANACPQLATETWPGGSTVTTVDAVDAFTDTDNNDEGDVSGAAFDPADPSVLWLAMNKGRLFKMHQVGDLYETFPEWSGGKPLRFANGAGELDAEGVTVGPDGAIYVTSERDNTNSGVSYNKIARFDVGSVTAATTELVATHEWDVNDKVVTGTNLGLEGVTYVPDEFLVAAGWEVGGTAYRAATQPTPGLFVTAVEATGMLHFFSLPLGGSPVEVKVESSGLPNSMDVTYDADRQALWALCDDTCAGAYNLLRVVDGDVAVEHSYARPSGMPNLNNEGMAIAPASTCTDGFQDVVWTDDGDTDGFSLRAGTLTCPEPAQQPVAPTVTVSSPTVQFGKATTLAVTVAAAGVTPTGKVTVTIDGTALPAATLGAAGTVRVAAPKLFRKPRVAPYPVVVSYAGDAAVEPGSASGMLRVVKGKAAVKATAPRTAVVKKTRVRMVVLVTNPDGVTATGKVRISGGGLTVRSVQLVDGRAVVRLPAFQRVGRKKLTIAYRGDQNLPRATTSKAIRVVR
ncbi:lamin tail domain-containing protein [Nocardioides dongxiaopingii]|uniref:lamin tail domain-containing protein n=1 Tax=Nocardioides dongxiaopingii TaxID=2576036 RepID=UPI0010C768CD|nr:lamin tail domain-containing protein [Nocardioides dongxiaopingii]